MRLPARRRRGRPSARRRIARRGIVAALVAMLMVVLLGVTAFTLDGGGAYDARGRANAAAEAAARAAALRMVYPPAGRAPSLADAIAAGKAVAAANGFRDDGIDAVVTIVSPPRTGAFAGQSGYFEASVTALRARTFSAVFGSGRMAVVGRAVCAGGYVPTRGSVLVLDAKAKQAASLNGSTLTLSGDLIVNSSDSKAFSLQDRGQLTAANLIVSGGIERTNRDNSVLRGDITTGVPPTPDPLAGLAPPPPGLPRSVDDYKTTVGGVDHYALPPGRYDALKFDADDVVTLAPGSYYVENDGIEFKEAASVSGDGVLLYNASGKDTKFSTAGAIRLTPPTSGAWSGVTLAVAGDKRGISFKTGTDLEIYGKIYAPRGQVSFQEIDGVLGGFPDLTDLDWDTFPDDGPGNGGNGRPSSVKATIIAGRLKVEKNSTLTVRGTDVAAQRPFFGIME